MTELRNRILNRLSSAWCICNLFHVLLEGSWNIAEPILVKLGTSSITCLHPMGQEMWAACGADIFKISTKVSSSRNSYSIEKVNVQFIATYGHVLKIHVYLYISLSVCLSFSLSIPWMDGDQALLATPLIPTSARRASCLPSGHRAPAEQNCLVADRQVLGGRSADNLLGHCSPSARGD